jgi:Domain of unknown function (DUF5666)
VQTEIPTKEGIKVMTKLSRALGAAMLCLGLLVSANVLANQDPMAQPAKEKQKKPDMVTISGTVSAISDSSLTIVDSDKKEHTIAITGDTKVTKAGKDAALTDVKANDSVVVEAKKGSGDTWTAVKILVS